MVANREREHWRTPGCTDACVWVRALRPGAFFYAEEPMHDLESHRIHERRAMLAEQIGAIVRTGPLVIDSDRLLVTLDGESVLLSPTELRVVLALARRGGGVVPVRAMLREAFDAELDVVDQDDRHLVRMTVTRIRRRLGRAKSLIETRQGIGWRLVMVPPGTEPPPYRPLTSAGRRKTGWAEKHAACRRCATTERTHQAHGYCFACYRYLYYHGEFRREPPAGSEP